jgi:hypothetical protein
VFKHGEHEYEVQPVRFWVYFLKIISLNFSSFRVIENLHDN